MMQTDIKPCPFCGWEKIHVYSKSGEKKYIHSESRFRKNINYQVHCRKCHARGPKSQRDEIEAVELWNMRK